MLNGSPAGRPNSSLDSLALAISALLVNKPSKTSVAARLNNSFQGQSVPGVLPYDDMSKLYKLKEWFSLEDAAKRLTSGLGEPITIADVTVPRN